MTSPDKVVNVMGQSCPMPIIALAKAVRHVEPGQIVQITGDDPIFDIGVKDFCQAKGYELLELRQDSERQFTAFIKC